MDINKLEAGRELDALVAKEIMGWRQEYVRHIITGEVAGWWKEPEYLVPPGGDDAEKVPAYSTDDGPSWGVVDKLINEGYCPALLYDDNGHWALSLEGAQNVPIGPDPQDIATSFFVSADMWCDTRQLAICRAALKVKGVK